MKQGQKLTETTGNVTKTRGFQKGQKLTETTPKSELDIFVSETLSNPDKVFKQSVTGNPIPHVNPTVSTEETAKAAEKYAKEATAGDGYENYSLEELRKKFEAEDELYNGTDTSYGYKGNPISNTLDFIGRTDAWKEQQKAISDYKALKKAYENRRAAYTEYKASNENYTENAEDAIKKLKERKNKAESEEEKKDIDNEIKEIRQGLYGDGNVLTSIGKGAKSGADSLLKAVASTGDFLFGNLAKALGFKNNIFSSTNQYYGQKYDDSKREAQRSSAAWGDKYNISGQVSEGVTAALPDALLAIVTGGSSATSKVGQLGQAAHSLTYGTAIRNAIKSTAENPFYWTSFARELGTDYEEAIESGASEAEATAYALLTASVNAAVEIGGDTGAGGIQTLPEALKETNGKKRLLWNG